MMGEPCGDQGRTTTGENAPVGGGVAHQQDENPEADEGDAEAHDEHHVNAAREQREQSEGHERLGQGTDGIERAVDPEDGAEPPSRGFATDYTTGTPDSQSPSAVMMRAELKAKRLPVEAGGAAGAAGQIRR